MRPGSADEASTAITYQLETEKNNDDDTTVTELRSIGELRANNLKSANAKLSVQGIAICKKLVLPSAFLCACPCISLMMNPI